LPCGHARASRLTAAREFAEGELASVGKECEAKGEYPGDIIREAAQLGKMGLHASDSTNVYFNNVGITRENLVGVEGNGFTQLMKFLDYSRLMIASDGASR
jgi:acyl-CoA dehydrogenase